MPNPVGAGIISTYTWSSRQRELPPKPLTEPDLNLSAHPALVIQIDALHYESPSLHW